MNGTYTSGLENIISNITNGPEKKIPQKIKNYFTKIGNYIKEHINSMGNWEIGNSWSDRGEKLKTALRNIGKGALVALAYIGITTAATYLVYSLPIDAYVKLTAAALGLSIGYKAGKKVYDKTEDAKMSTLAGVMAGAGVALPYFLFLYPFDPNYIVKTLIPKSKQFYTLLGMNFVLALMNLASIEGKNKEED